MAGSDWKRFLGHHRKNNGRRLIAEVNYEKLLSDIQAKKEQGKTSEDKMARLVGKASEYKEEKLMKEHKKAWSAMVPILEKELHQHQYELGIWVTQAIVRPSLVTQSLDMNKLLSEATTLELEYNKSRETLLKDIQKDIKLLRRLVLELKKLLLQKGDEQRYSEFITDIRCEIDAAKRKHTQMQDLLSVEWAELNDSLMPVYNQFTHVDTIDQFFGGVANAVWFWECPSENLRHKMAKEFEEVDSHFSSQLLALEKHYKKYSTVMERLSWSIEDKIRFNLILAQYPAQLKNRRQLYIDRLIRELPGKTRKEIVEYEEGSCAEKYYQNQRAVLIKSWQIAHSNLLDEVHQVYEEATKQWQLKDAMQMETQQQRSLCEVLSKKVTKWRKQCLELQEQAAKEKAEKDALEEKTRKAEELKEKRNRDVVKDKLLEYNLKKDRERLIAEEKHKQLVEEFKMITDEGLKKGKERMAFREQLLITKQEEMAAIAERVEEKRREKERQLEALRLLVRVEAPYDPRRALMDTQASRARVLTNEEEHIELQKPLFEVHSFTDKKILSDRRVRVSNALREAGLISTQYAKEILSTIPPPKPIRKDQKSTIFK